MSQPAIEGFLTPEEGYKLYNLSERESLFASELDQQLVSKGIAQIAISLTTGDFETLFNSYEACIEECPDELGETYYLLDGRFGNEVGNVRKEIKVDPQTGIQLADAKNYMHLTAGCEERWARLMKAGPKPLRDLIQQGLEVHDETIVIAKRQLTELEETHPNITQLYFPSPGTSRIFTRLLSYDEYVAGQFHGDVAKPHSDIGGLTLHKYDDAPGFEILSSNGEWVPRQTSIGRGFMFMGDGHEKVYGRQARARKKPHRVRRQEAADGQIITKRHSAVSFVDAPQVDYQTKFTDTLPQLTHVASGTVLELEKAS